MTRLGRWIDFKNDYKSMYPWYMESIWWVFKQLYTKGLVYKGFKVGKWITVIQVTVVKIDIPFDLISWIVWFEEDIGIFYNFFFLSTTIYTTIGDEVILLDMKFFFILTKYVIKNNDFWYILENLDEMLPHIWMTNE